MDNVTVIKAKKGLAHFDLKELWQYRELFGVLAMREFQVRYKQTLIGVLWAIIRPLLTMVVFTFLFGKIAQIPSDGVPYPIFSYSGLVLWTYFSAAVAQSSSSMVGNSKLITKVYFPRAIIPASSTIVGLIDYVISFTIVFAMMIYYGYPLTWSLLLIPVVVFITWILSVGIGLWFSALNVKYRDVQYALPFFTQTLMYITPVIYPVSLAGNYQWILALNPLSGLIEAHRALILGSLSVDWGLLGISTVITLLVFISGYMYFKYVEKYFADII
ncbi:MAG TPA: ABC transporter permease [Candidatus Dojkabacteria bacterium]|nr:ABC transporter permease [Candidatus Dojkabacteria bacterium]